MAGNVLPQRIGPNSDVIVTSEGSTPGTDPGSPVSYRLPVSNNVPWVIGQDTTEAPVFMLGVNPYECTYNMIEAGGQIPMGLDMLTCPTFLKWGMPKYLKTNLPTGAYHDFWIDMPGNVVTIGSFQVQGASRESPAQYVRGKYHRVSKIDTAYAPSGAAPWNVTVSGSGSRASTDIGGTVIDNGYLPVSYFNGQASIDGLSVTGMPQFSMGIDFGVSKMGGAFNSGVYTSVNPGPMNVAGNMELSCAIGTTGPEKNFDFSDQAFAQVLRSFQCLWADGPLNSMTGFMFAAMPALRFSAKTPQFAGKMGLTLPLAYKVVYNPTASKIAASAHGTVKGPFVITTGSNDVFSAKPEGGTTVNVTFPAGTYTAAGLAALLNADSTFNTKFLADSFGVTVADGQGYLRYTSLVKGSTSSVAFQTGTANNCAATLGLNNTVFVGLVTAFFVRVFNSSQTAFA